MAKVFLGEKYTFELIMKNVTVICLFRMEKMHITVINDAFPA